MATNLRQSVSVRLTYIAFFAVGTGVGVVAGFALAGAFRLFDAVPDVYEDDGRSLTAFITEPDAFSVLVAIAAAVAGTLALTHDRSGTLVGVLISVTTIPAIADIGVGLAFWDRSEVVGAATQLAINLVCLVAVGAVTLAVLRRVTPGGHRAVWHP